LQVDPVVRDFFERDVVEVLAFFDKLDQVPELLVCQLDDLVVRVEGVCAVIRALHKKCCLLSTFVAEHLQTR
jgi:hypothetical protein